MAETPNTPKKLRVAANITPEPVGVAQKINWRNVVIDIGKTLAGFASVLTIASASANAVSLPAGDVLWITGAAGILTAIGSTLANYKRTRSPA